MRLKFGIENSAFEEPNYIEENVRILEKVISDIKSDKKEGAIIDINGNTVGNWLI